MVRRSYAFPEITMSMDLSVWSSRPFALPEYLPELAAWNRSREEWSYDGDCWQVLVFPTTAHAEDSVTTLLPGARFVAYVTLEPIGAPPSAYAFLEQTIRSLARNADGVWLDPSGSAYKYNEGSF